MLGRLRKVPVDEMFGAGGGDFTAWLQNNVDVVNEAVDLRLSGVSDRSSGSTVDVVARDESGNTVAIQNVPEGEADASLGKLIKGMAGAEATTGVFVVPRSHPEQTSIVSWLNERTPFDFYVLQLEAYRIDDSAPAPVLNMISGPAHAAPPPENSLRDLPEVTPEEAATLVAPVPEDPEATYVEGDPGAGQEPYVMEDPPAGEDPVAADYVENGYRAEEAADEAVMVEEPAPEALDLESPQVSASSMPEPEATHGQETSTASYGVFESYSATETAEAPPEEELLVEGDPHVDVVVEAETPPAEQDRDEGADELAQWFWGELLSKAEQRTRVHAGVSPPASRVASASAGLAGLDYNYVIEDHSSSVELYINRGEGRESENETIFNALQATQDAIEYNFGGPLDWQREADPDGGLRISSRVEDAGLRDEGGRWSEIQDSMVDAMVRLERAMRPHIARLQI